MKTKLLSLGLLGLSVVTSQAFATVTFSGSSGNLAASASFTVSGGGTTLTVVLTNTSSADVLVPADVLTALFFSDGTLTPVSATLTSGSSIVYGSGAQINNNVGGEWAYGSGLAGAPGGATQGISSSGFGLFGNANFNGPNLDPPTAVDGLNYGILSAGDNTATGNTGVTGNPLIKNSVTFVLSGTNLSESAFSHVSFQYGTALTETNIPTPEPGILGLVALGLLGVGYGRRRTLAAKSEDASV